VGWVRAKANAVNACGRILVGPILLDSRRTSLPVGMDTRCFLERVTLVRRNCADRGDQDCSGKSDLPRPLLQICSKFGERSTGFFHRFETRLQGFERGGILRGLTLRGAQSLDVGLEGPDILGHFLRRAEQLGPRRALLRRDHRSGWRRNQDAGSWRRSRLVRDYVAREGGGIKLELLEPHAPELNPVEYLWAHWKQYEMPNFCPKDFAELSAFARAKLMRTPLAKLSSRPSGNKPNCPSNVTLFVKNQ
jgi:hypothetical protein